MTLSLALAYTAIKNALLYFFISHRRYGLLFCLLCTLTMLNGCNDTQPQEAIFSSPQYKWGKITGRTVTIRGHKNDISRPYMTKAFARYEAITGNTVRIEALTHEELAVNLPAAFVEGRIEKPDLILSFGGSSIERLEPEKNFYDFTNAPWVSDLTDTAINHTIYNGKVIGLPYGEASVSGMLYNKKLFAELGIAVPKNQQEFLEACESLLRHGITPVYLPYMENTMMLYQFPLDSIVQRSQTLEQLNKGLLSYSQIPEMQKIVSWYKLMADRGYFGPNYTKNGWAGMDPAMRGGKYAMMICWDTWLYTNFTGDPSHFGIMPAFMEVPENGVFEGPNLVLLIANKNSPQLDVALDLITFIADPYNYNLTLAGMYTAPAFKNQVGSISTPQYMAAERLIEKHFYDSTAMLRIRGFSQLDAGYIQKHMQDSNYTVQDCLRDMDAARLKRAAAH